MFSLFDLLVLSGVPSLAPNRLRALVEHCGGPSAALAASPAELASAPGFGRTLGAQVWRALHDPSGEAPRFADAPSEG